MSEVNEQKVEPDRATFQVKGADQSFMDIGSIGISCEVDLDAKTGLWKAWSNEAPGSDAYDRHKPVACLKHFIRRLED